MRDESAEQLPAPLRDVPALLLTVLAFNHFAILPMSNPRLSEFSHGNCFVHPPCSAEPSAQPETAVCEPIAYGQSLAELVHGARRHGGRQARCAVGNGLLQAHGLSHATQPLQRAPRAAPIARQLAFYGQTSGTGAGRSRQTRCHSAVFFVRSHAQQQAASLFGVLGLRHLQPEVSSGAPQGLRYRLGSPGDCGPHGRRLCRAGSIGGL